MYEKVHTSLLIQIDAKNYYYRGADTNMRPYKIASCALNNFPCQLHLNIIPRCHFRALILIEAMQSFFQL